MRYRLRTLLILAAVGPPLIAGAWFFANRLARIVAYAELADWLPLIKQAAAMFAVIAVFTVVAALCQRSQTTY